MKKAITIVTLALLLSVCFNGTTWAAEPADMHAAAQELADMGLLKGDSAGLALDEPCNRLQGAVLFTRLLGKEADALGKQRSHPFLDIVQGHWAAPYLAYLYNSGLAYGQAYNHYGAEEMLPAHFATFCLRALGYSEGSEKSDFKWQDALDMMVEKGVISGNLRNRLRYTPYLTRGDAVLLAYATLAAPMEEGGQTLLQYLVSGGAISPEKAASFSAAIADFDFYYPQGLFSPEELAALGAQSGLKLGDFTYEPGAEAEEQLYLALREVDSPYDICLLPGYLVERLRLDGLLHKFSIRDFGGKESFIPLARDNPYWFDAPSGDYYALPLAFTVPSLYYDGSRVEKPDWSWLFREAYRGGVYLPQDPSRLAPLALHYYNLPYDTVDDKKMLPALTLLAGQMEGMPALMGPHMLDIAEKEGAIFGVISSREAPELERRRKENPAYASWQAILPPSGAPASFYYAVIMENADLKTAKVLLNGLMQPQTAAVHAMYGGYLPAVSGVGGYLEGAVAAVYPVGRSESCRPLYLDISSRNFYEQFLRNALLLQAQNTVQQPIAALSLAFTRNGELYREHQVELAKLPDMRVKAFQKEAARLGLSLWQEYYDGPAEGPSWSLTITFADGTAKSYGGYTLPLNWQDVGAALLALTGEEMMPATLI